MAGTKSCSLAIRGWSRPWTGPTRARRTFELIPHLVYRGKSWSFDEFWSRPNIILARQLNQPNYGQQFFGAYFTYKGRPNRYFDLYYLALLADTQNATPLNGEIGRYGIHTLGSRWQGLVLQRQVVKA